VQDAVGEFGEIILTVVGGFGKVESAFETGGKSDDLEDRAKRILSLHGAVVHRALWIIEQFRQKVRVVAIERVEQVWVKAGRGGDSQYAAGIPFHHHHCAREIFQGQFRVVLQVFIQRQIDIAGLFFLFLS
jgi:hypothetical protein